MKRFKNILVVTEFSVPIKQNPAIKRAVQLAKQSDAKLTLMEVVSEPTGLLKDYQGIIKADELTQLMINNRRADLKEARSSLDEEAINIEEIVIAGRDFIEIIRQVLVARHDIVIKVAKPGFQGFSSGDFHLMRKCPCPVWLVKPDHPIKNNKILAAIDLSLEKTAEGQLMNELIMDLASSFKSTEQSELHVLSCWSLFGESMLRDSPFIGVSKSELSNLLESEEALNQGLQEKLCDKYQKIPFIKHLVKGSPDVCIPKFVLDHDIDTVVMGTVGRTGIPGLLIGNTAESILKLIDSSVITVKPQGFRSPVE